MYESLAVLAGFAMLYSILAGRIERTWISGPIIFTAFGVLLGPFGLGMISEDRNPELLRVMAELTLALVLFSDAAGTDLGLLRRKAHLPIRLLAIGLPLTILLGFGIGELMFAGFSVFEVALLATMLAPTDAALGMAVVKNEHVPESMRQGLNVESGLNDGICVPILFLFLALAQGEGAEHGAWALGLELFAEEVGIGMAVALVVTAVAAFLLKTAQGQGILSHTFRTITVVAVAATCFSTAQSLGGSGFIASFVGGLFFSGFMRRQHEELLHSAEGLGETMALLTWVLFGSAVVGKAFDQAAGDFTWEVLVYAILSLTLIRMLPVYLSVGGLGYDRNSKLFLGWFGPRGLASIVFAIIVMDAGLPNTNMITRVVASTVILSVIFHGMSANPWAKRMGKSGESGG
ncbi:MAG: cation:proton antiporter [Planctomycetota bacterium]|jgi:NhaP-type Na+/H+ or K+/H+ antiporter